MSITKPVPQVNTGHPHGIHCTHLHGADSGRWCDPCKRGFSTWCEASEPGGIAFGDCYRRFREAADLNLVTTVLGQIEATVLPCPDAYLDAFPLLPDWVEEEGELIPQLALSA